MLNLRTILEKITSSKFQVFTDDRSVSINRARMRHLASLHLDIKGKSVLEVGAGIGLLTEYFEKNRCQIVSTDSRKENVIYMRKVFPNRPVELLDLEKPIDYKKFNNFDIIFCYGTLYHLSNPKKAITMLSKVCNGMILLETCVTLGSGSSVIKVKERGKILNQSSSFIGTRPTRKYVMDQLKTHFGYAYVTKTQPRHLDFILNWKHPPEQSFYRAVFIGSKKPIRNSLLLKQRPEIQTN